jgi:hypothetical protein
MSLIRRVTPRSSIATRLLSALRHRHDALDADRALFAETRAAAETLSDAVRQLHAGYRPPGGRTADPRAK